MLRMNTCRLCKRTTYDSNEPLFKYGVRHYVHVSCGFDKWGHSFLDKVPKHLLGNIPYKILQDRGILEKVLGMLKEYRDEQAKKEKVSQ